MTRVRNQLQVEQLQRSQHAYIQLKERHRIARDLHDTVSQPLFALGAFTNSLTSNHSTLSPKLSEDIAYIKKLTDIALKGMRLQLFELRSKELVKLPIEKLVRDLVELVKNRIGAKFFVDIDNVNEHCKHNLILNIDSKPNVGTKVQAVWEKQGNHGGKYSDSISR